MIRDYTFDDHLHNYAVWTAARAVQRGFVSTGKIKRAIEDSGLQEFTINCCGTDEIEFERFHRDTAKQIIKSFEKQGVAEATYGRAAKIIAVYLKTSIILPLKGQTTICSAIHPPIDNILLTNISKCSGNKHVLQNPWTKLNEEQYWSLVECLKREFKQFDWTLEKYWSSESRSAE